MRICGPVGPAVPAWPVDWAGRQGKQWGSVADRDQVVAPAIERAEVEQPSRPGPAEPFSLRAITCAEWERIRQRHALASPPLAEFVGLSMEYADYQMRFGQSEPGRPAIVSTIKIMQAGFHDVIDTETMFRTWFSLFQRKRLLPPA